MSHVRCPYCGASEGRCTSSGAGRFVTECRSCGRVVEEHRSEVEELFVERAQDTPLCIVTPDFSENECYRAPPLEDDPYENIGFITAFSTWSLELSPLFTATSTSFSGHLAELERLLLDPVYPTGGSNADVPGVSMSMVDTLRAYFQIVEVSSILGLERDFCDHAIQLFRDCASTTYLRNRNIEALATAALVQAIREAQEPRTLQEISAAATIPQKEIAKYMKVLSDALKLSQPINSNSIAVHMPRFCNLLQLSKATQDLATHIGEVVINKSFCTRRNPISISAAAIYLSCQLEDKRKTQTEICKATGLTEVTLRKVYKELLENLSDLLPPNYTPAVAPEKAFPVSAAALGRVCATRVAAGGSLVPSIASPADSSVATTYVTGPGITLNSSGISGAAVYPEGNSGASSGAGVSCILPSPASLVRATGPLPSVNAIPGVHTKSAGASSTDGSRLPTHLFKMPAGVTNSSASPAVDTGPAGAAASQDRTQNFELDRDLERHKEKERERNDSDSIPFGLSTVPPTLKGSMPAVSSANIGLPFLHFRPFMQDLAKVTWPPQALYSVPVLRPDENVSGQVSERNREDELLHLGLKGPQYMSVLPGVVGDGTAGMSASIPSTQLKTFQSIGLSSSGARDQPGTLERTEEEEVGKEAEHNEQGDANSPPLHQLSSGSSIGNLNFGAAGLAANARPPMFQSFPQSLWGFSSPGSMPVGVFPPHFLAPCGGLLQNLPQFGETNSGADKGGRVTIPARETPSQVTLPSTEAAETMGRLPSGSTTTQLSGKASQASMTQLLPTAWPPFRPLYIPPMNSNNITDDGHSDGSVATRRDAGHLEGVGAKSGPPLRHLNSGAGNNLSAFSTTDFLPNLSIGINAGLQTSSCLPGSATSHRSDESGK